MTSSDTEGFPELNTYKDLPLEGDKVFTIGGNPVRFAIHEDSEGLKGWTVTIQNPNYFGLLLPSTTTFSNADMSPEPAYAYAFKHTAPPVISPSHFEVFTVAELKSIFFGESVEGHMDTA